MEAKDTVIKDLSKPILDNLDLPMGQAIAKEQAEISFKAGQEEQRRKQVATLEDKDAWHWQGEDDYLESLACLILIEAGDLRNLIKAGRQERIKEVVEWISVNRPRLWHEPDWQAKLKEWEVIKDGQD